MDRRPGGSGGFLARVIYFTRIVHVTGKASQMCLGDLIGSWLSRSSHRLIIHRSTFSKWEESLLCVIRWRDWWHYTSYSAPRIAKTSEGPSWCLFVSSDEGSTSSHTWSKGIRIFRPLWMSTDFARNGQTIQILRIAVHHPGR
jgi:hypothetical protein